MKTILREITNKGCGGFKKVAYLFENVKDARSFIKKFGFANDGSENGDIEYVVEKNTPENLIWIEKNGYEIIENASYCKNY